MTDGVKKTFIEPQVPEHGPRRKPTDTSRLTASWRKPRIALATMDVVEATRTYEAWMRRCTHVVDSQVRHKHQQMRDDLFSFYRATFYRWAQRWPDVCRDLCQAPRVLAVGDLHVESFGTWRDAEGRLCWGVDDFDEACSLPYTNDLVRLAASAKIVIDDAGLGLKFKVACEAIVEGYRQTLRTGGRPIVLGERDVNLALLGMDALEPATDFWAKLQGLPPARRPLPHGLRHALARTLPDPRLDYRVVRREAGIGSLGQPRFVAIASWEGGLIAREAKAVVPSAQVWLGHGTGRAPSLSQRALDGAVRSRDPFQVVAGRWLVRRLSPDANPIEIAELPKKRDDATLLQAMGTETANVHVGSRGHVRAILGDLARRKASWLRVAAKAMVEDTERDWKNFRKASR